MERFLYNRLIDWKKSEARRPLIVNGARQVGKTWLLEEFGRREYSKVAKFSLDRDKVACGLFEREKDVEKLVRGLSALSGIDITAGDTLLVLDEIQECPEALTSLKFFCEDMSQIHVAVAGSLLGISIHGQSSYPVGKVDVVQLYPMNFGEFLMATGHGGMARELMSGDWDVLNGLSEEYIDLLRQYYYVGGMPAVVQAYAEGAGLTKVREIQQKILDDYEHDFSKHAPVNEVPRIRMVWQSIPSQLAKENKKFIYGALRKGARASAYEIAIQWLIDAGLIYKVKRVNAVRMPLKFYEDNDAFKLFMLDVGLMGAMTDMPVASMLVDNTALGEYKGAFTELYVCTQLVTTGVQVYYHSVEQSRIELDFVLQLGDKVIPIEVKAEENVYSKSLRTFIQKNPDLHAMRFSMKPYIQQEWMENIPLFAFREELMRRKNIIQSE